MKHFARMVEYNYTPEKCDIRVRNHLFEAHDEGVMISNKFTEIESNN